jgi:hypothetical protein
MKKHDEEKFEKEKKILTVNTWIMTFVILAASLLLATGVIGHTGGKMADLLTAEAFNLSEYAASVKKDGEEETYYETFAEAWKNAVAGDSATVTLLKDVTAIDGSFGITYTDKTTHEDVSVDYIFTNGAEITLDLNGYTIDRGLYKNGALTVAEADVPTIGSVIYCDAAFTLKDSSATETEAGTGLITGGATRSSGETSQGWYKTENGYGGGIYAPEGLTIEGGRIEGNLAQTGGGIFAKKDVDISNAVISNNEAHNFLESFNGYFCGGFFYEQTDTSVYSLEIKNSKLNDNKGVGFNFNARNGNNISINVENTSFGNNKGEGIIAEGAKSLSLKNGSAIGNGGTGVICSVLNMTDCNIKENAGAGASVVTAEFTSCEIENNLGSGIVKAEGTLTLTDCTVSGNVAQPYETGGQTYVNYGGGIYAFISERNSKAAIILKGSTVVKDNYRDLLAGEEQRLVLDNISFNFSDKEGNEAGSFIQPDTSFIGEAGVNDCNYYPEYEYSNLSSYTFTQGWSRDIKGKILSDMDGVQFVAAAESNLRAIEGQLLCAKEENIDNWVDMTTGNTVIDIPSNYWTDEVDGQKFYDTSWYNSEDADGVFKIGTAAQLAGFAYILNNPETYNYESFADKTVRLTADIDMSAHQWVCMSKFKGTFDGDGHTVSGIYLSTISNEVRYLGFISRLEGGAVKNLNLTNTYVAYKSQDNSDYFFSCGAIVGYNDQGKIINCSANAYVESIGYLGGIVGVSSQSEPTCIHNNYFIGSLKSVTLSTSGNISTCVGAIAGEVEQETVYNNYAVAYSVNNAGYLSNAVGHINTGWYRDYVNDVRLNYLFDGTAFVADYDESSLSEHNMSGFVPDGVSLGAISTEQLLTLLNKGVQYIIGVTDNANTYYQWKIDNEENDGYPIFVHAFSVTLNLIDAELKEGVIGKNAAQIDKNYTIYLKATDKHSLPTDILITVGEQTLTSGTDYNISYDSGDLEIVILKKCVTDDITISITASPQYQTDFYYENLEDNEYSDDGIIHTISYAPAGSEVTAVIPDENEWKALFVLDYNLSTLNATVTQDGETVLKVYFTRIRYTVSWLDENGGVIKTESVKKTLTPEYSGETPTKASTAQYTYTFSGWSPDIAAVTGDAVYTAQFDSNARSYNVVWKNDGGATLKTENGVLYGTVPEYNGDTPIKAATEIYRYIFSGWFPEIGAVSGNTEYTARFERKLLKLEGSTDGGGRQSQIDAPDGVNENALFVLKEISARDSSLKPSNKLRAAGYFNARLLLNGEDISFGVRGQLFTIRFAAPDGAEDGDLFSLISYENGTPTVREVEVSNGYISFTTYTLGDFVLAEEDSDAAVIGGVTGGVAALLIILILLYIFCLKRKVVFVIDSFEVKKIAVSFKSQIDIPEELARYKWYVDKDRDIAFTGGKMGLKNITLYAESADAK